MIPSRTTLTSTCICGDIACHVPCGLCHCGCGEQTAIAEWDNEKHGYVAGMPRKYLNGHNKRLKPNVRGEVRYGIVGNEDVVFIPLTHNSETIVDAENVHLSRLNPFLWKEYAAVAINGRTVKLHSLIFNCPDGYEPDHHNRNKLDNRKSNLRRSTHKQNTCNSGPRGTHPTGYKGVTNLPNGKFRSRIRHEGKQIKLGCHISVINAAVAYDKAAFELFGNFAYLNFPEKRNEYEAYFREAAK